MEPKIKYFSFGKISLITCIVCVMLTGIELPKADSASTGLRAQVEWLYSQGRYEEADQLVEHNLKSSHRDYELLWAYVQLLANGREENERAIVLGERWLPVAREERPPALGRLLKETGMAVLYGRYRHTHNESDLYYGKELLEEAIQVNPHVMEAYFHLALIAAYKGKLSKAQSLMTRARETSTTTGEKGEMVRRKIDIMVQNPEIIKKVAKSMFSGDHPVK